MFGFKKKTPVAPPAGVIMHKGPLSNLPPIDPAYRKQPSGYIEIYVSKKDRCHLRIRGGNNKIRFHSENYYSKRNARRAARLFAQETGLPVLDRSIEGVTLTTVPGVINARVQNLKHTEPMDTTNTQAAPRGPHYSHVNSKGVRYYLNMKYVSLRAGELVPIYYFSKDIRKEASPLPSGFQVNENPRNGFLTVKTLAMIASDQARPEED